MNEWVQANALRIPMLVGATCRSGRMDRFQHGRSARTVGREDRRINRRIGPVRRVPGGFKRRRIQEARQPSTIVEGQARRGPGGTAAQALRGGRFCPPCGWPRPGEAHLGRPVSVMIASQVSIFMATMACANAQTIGH